MWAAGAKNVRVDAGVTASIDQIRRAVFDGIEFVSTFHVPAAGHAVCLAVVVVIGAARQRHTRAATAIHDGVVLYGDDWVRDGVVVNED